MKENNLPIPDNNLPPITDVVYPSQTNPSFATIAGAMIPTPQTDLFADVVAFHEKFELGYSGPPRSLDPEFEKLRMIQMREETAEMDAAADDAERFDACLDKVYFIMGYCYLRGWNFNEGWRRVHEANMKKVRALPDGSNSKRKSGNDVVKPEGWTHPDLTDLVTDKGSSWNWEDFDEFKSILAKLIIRDRVPHQYGSLAACIRAEFRPIAERYEAGDRSAGLLIKMRQTNKVYSDFLKQ